jgi:hypothetical protein
VSTPAPPRRAPGVPPPKTENGRRTIIALVFVVAAILALGYFAFYSAGSDERTAASPPEVVPVTPGLPEASPSAASSDRAPAVPEESSAPPPSEG